MAAAPVLLPGDPVDRGLAGYSPRGRKEADTTERLNSAFSRSAPPSRGSHMRFQDRAVPRWNLRSCDLEYRLILPIIEMSVTFFLRNC